MLTIAQQTGYVYEVDLEYPDELHDLHNDYPCAAEKIKVNDEMLSDYCQNIKNRFKISSGNVSKLIPTLHHKEKYVFHEENLKLYLSLGLKLKKSALSFRIQSKSMVKRIH